jgi:hypothetical protein
MATTKDVYDEAVEYLTAHPNEIYSAWVRGPYAGDDAYGDREWSQHPGSYLFRTVFDDSCATEIRAGLSSKVENYDAPPVVMELAADETVPENPEDIRPEDLPRFAYWQRRFDRELVRT